MILCAICFTSKVETTAQRSQYRRKTLGAASRAEPKCTGQNEKASGAKTYQAVTVAQGHFAGVRLVIEVPHIVAVRRVRMGPRQPAPLPIFHPELPGEQASLQGEVEQEVVARGGQLVEELRG